MKRSAESEFLKNLLTLLGHDLGLQPGFLEQARDEVRKALSTRAKFRNRFRKRAGTEPSDDASIDLHEQADLRIDLFSMVYLDLALQCSDATSSRAQGGAQGLVGPYGGGLALPPAPVLLAMREELECVRERLTPQLAKKAVSETEFASKAWLACLGSFTPDRHEVLARWAGDSSTRLECLSQADTWVALVDFTGQERPEGVASATASKERGYMAPLHIALCAVDPPEPSDVGAEEFSVHLYPSLLTALGHYSSHLRAGEQPGTLGWWQTLDVAETWAADHYAAALANHPDMRSPLRGPHVARWDLALPRALALLGAPPQSVCGGSHGAAFSLCLMQAIARAHVERPL